MQSSPPQVADALTEAVGASRPLPHTGAKVTEQKQSWNFAENEEIASGRYAVALLGGGTRAEAWVAWDQRLHTLVVVKILRPDLVVDAAALAALEREARVLNELQHPAIVRCFDAVLDGPRPHLVLESLDGPRLSTLVRRFGRLAPEQAVPLGIEVCSALAFMHSSGYVHLDVKPRNLIMSATPKLIDLGIVRTRAEIAALNSTVGTDAYMAPEQCQAETLATVGPPADVWGLGVTLYFAVTGRHAFRRGPDAPQYPQLTEEPATLDELVPASLAVAIRGCLQKEAERRPTAGQLSAMLEPLLDDARRVARRRLRTRRR